MVDGVESKQLREGRRLRAMGGGVGGGGNNYGRENVEWVLYDTGLVELTLFYVKSR